MDGTTAAANDDDDDDTGSVPADGTASSRRSMSCLTSLTDGRTGCELLPPPRPVTRAEGAEWDTPMAAGPIRTEGDSELWGGDGTASGASARCFAASTWGDALP